MNGILKSRKGGLRNKPLANECFFQLYNGMSTIKNTMKRHVNITLEPKVLETVDRERGLIKRSTFLENLIKVRYGIK